ncbi:MAG: sigma-70 family RNA polymerase sigma factor [Prevotella sp.]|nr:sigma-70 family RNA polymerase sigma factor [Prevotella sp.]MBQ8702100.1 sigma-70 family RNA polymerase sigma factor [Prevotella sp.]MBQ9650959.1 sigma-70 family RNA polymerase sigma factor [Prevotella sp.]
MDKLQVMTDEELALSYVNGNNKAFDLLLSRTQSKLFSYILFVVHDRDKADDVFQETFVKAIAKLHQGKYTTSGKFLAWIMRIAHNVIMDSYREQRYKGTVDVAGDNDLSNISSDSLLDSNIESQYVNTQILSDVKKMMNLLPAPQREVVFMRYYQEMSFKEIAEVTGVSINTSLGRMRYALLNMRRMARDNQLSLQMMD